MVEELKLVAPQKKLARKSELVKDLFRVIGFLLCAASHPIYLLLSYSIVFSANMAAEISTNTYLIYPIPFCILLLLFAIIRYIIFYRIHPRYLSNRQLLNRFILVNLPGFYFLDLFKSFITHPMESNGFGFMLGFFFFFFFGVGIVIFIFTLLSVWQSKRKQPLNNSNNILSNTDK